MNYSIQIEKEYDQNILNCYIRSFNGNENCKGDGISDWCCGK
jgi:hypothetical protein